MAGIQFSSEQMSPQQWSAQTIVVGILVCVLAGTVIVTFLALVGLIKLGGSSQEQHDYYLKRLFHALVVEVVVVAVAFFGKELNGGNDKHPPEPTPSPIATPTLSPAPTPSTTPILTTRPEIASVVAKPSGYVPVRYYDPSEIVDKINLVSARSENPIYLLKSGAIVQNDPKGVPILIGMKEPSSDTAYESRYNIHHHSYNVSNGGAIYDGSIAVGVSVDARDRFEQAASK